MFLVHWICHTVDKLISLCETTGEKIKDSHLIHINYQETLAHDTAASSKLAAHNNLVIMSSKILHHKLNSIKVNSSTWIHVQSITLTSVYA